MNLLSSIGKYKRLLITAVIVFATLLLLPTAIINIGTGSRRFDLTKTPVDKIGHHKTALIFGAGVTMEGEPTPYLVRRLETGTKLYKAQKVDKLLLSGDNSSANYNETNAMKNYAVKLGVNSDDIILDYAGFNTYDSCYRAKHIFHIDDAIVITQGYHLPRAVYTCNSLGVTGIGVAALHKGRDYAATYILREFISTNKAVLQAILKPQPTAL